MKLLVTGVGGLVGSAVAELAQARGHSVVGVDADMRGTWFGPAGSVEWRLRELEALGVAVVRADFQREAHRVRGVDAVVHCASQPSHDFSRAHVLRDSAVNYTGTVVLLEAVRTLAPEAVFVFLSTNKVYGDRVNAWDYAIEGERYVLDEDNWHADGVTEELRIDQSLHTPFGVSKLAADLMVQEYRRCFGLRTATLRCGCLTGTSGSPVELQGFLGHLVRSAVGGHAYTIYGHGGYQVRDNLDATDLAEAILLYADAPRDCVYNMGGGPANAVSVLEAIRYLKTQHGCYFPVGVGPARLGDHKWWVTSTAKFRADYPAWAPRKTVWETIDAMVASERRRGVAALGHAPVAAGAVA